jgi:hypothetical protein
LPLFTRAGAAAGSLDPDTINPAGTLYPPGASDSALHADSPADTTVLGPLSDTGPNTPDSAADTAAGPVNPADGVAALAALVLGFLFFLLVRDAVVALDA